MKTFWISVLVSKVVLLALVGLGTTVEHVKKAYNDHLDNTVAMKVRQVEAENYRARWASRQTEVRTPRPADYRAYLVSWKRGFEVQGLDSLDWEAKEMHNALTVVLDYLGKGE